VAVETVVVPQVKGRARPEWTAWTESVDVDSLHVFALRVFYCKSVVPAGATSVTRRTSTCNTTPRLQFIGNYTILQSVLQLYPDWKYDKVYTLFYQLCQLIPTFCALQIFCRLLYTQWVL